MAVSWNRQSSTCSTEIGRIKRKGRMVRVAILAELGGELVAVEGGRGGG